MSCRWQWRTLRPVEFSGVQCVLSRAVAYSASCRGQWRIHVVRHVEGSGVQCVLSRAVAFSAFCRGQWRTVRPVEGSGVQCVLSRDATVSPAEVLRTIPRGLNSELVNIEPSDNFQP